MKYFSVPADFSKSTIDHYARLNDSYSDSKVFETYGQIVIGNPFEAGRILGDIPQIDLEILKNYIEYSRLKGIGFNYTINGPCMSNREFTESGVKQMKDFLGQLYQAGVRSLTIALPSVIAIAKSTGYDFEIKASTLCGITNPNKARTYQNLGVDRIVLDESINRDFDTMHRIKEVFGERVEIIVNTLCYKDCAYRVFHYNQVAHDSVAKNEQSINTYYNHLCMLKRCEEVGNILKLSWVRPEDLHYYTSIGINYFKIQGRNTVLNGDPVRAVECYFQESFTGNLIELLQLFSPLNSFSKFLDNKKLGDYLKPFVENPAFCKHDCGKCGYCETYIKKCSDYEEARNINEMATKFYIGFDQFTQLIKESGEERTASSGEIAIKKTKVQIDLDL